MGDADAVRAEPTLRSRFSRGSASLRMSHHRTWPSEDTVISSDPVLDCSQDMSYTGSLHITSGSHAWPASEMIESVDMSLVQLCSR